jgi:putative DNA primase/helicase
LVRDAISTHGTSQFSAIDGGTRKLVTDTGAEVEESVLRVINRTGYWKDEGNKRIYGFTSEGLRRATKGYDFDRVTRALDEAKAFAKKGSKQASVTTWIPGEKRDDHLYWIDPEKLNS